MTARSGSAFITLTLSLCLAGCSPKTDDLTVYIQKIKNTTTAQVEPYPEFQSQPAFVYSADDARSPFARVSDRTTPVAVEHKSHCLQPDFKRPKAALETFGLDALSMTGTFSSQGIRWVLFKTKAGELLKAKKGSHIGLFYGQITSVGKDSVTIEQLLPDGAGCWQREEATLSLTSSAGDKNNV